MESIGEIKVKVSKFKADTAFQKLQRRWDSDFDLWRLKEYNAGKGYYSYTSNSPRNLANKSISMLTEAGLTIRIPEDVLKKDERETASNIERYLYGSFNANDETLMKIPDMPNLRSQMAWYAVLRGSFALRVYVYKNDKGETVTEVVIWDTYNLAFGIGKDGVEWAAYSRKASKEQIKSEWDVDVDSDIVDVLDVWTTTENGVIVAGEWAKKPEAHGLDYCPVFIMRVGATPPVWQERYPDTGVHVGESIYASNRGLYAPFNKSVSDLLTIVRRGVKVPLGVWSPGGTYNLDEDIWQVEKAASIPLDEGIVIKPLIEPSTPPDATGLINIMSSEIQRGGLSHIAEGELGFRLSGFAINQLQASISTVIVPFAECIERAYHVASLSLMQQFAQGGFKPVEVRGRTSRNQPFGVPKAVKISSDMIEGSWHPEIRLEPVLPKDDAQRYELARRATEGENPLLSMGTARDMLLRLDDPGLEDEKVEREFGGKLPIIRLWKAFLAAMADGDEPLAMNIVGELNRLMGVGQGGGAGGGGGAPGALDQLAAQSPGAGMPPGETGFSSSTMPSEQMGGMPGGAVNAQLPLFGKEI